MAREDYEEEDDDMTSEMTETEDRQVSVSGPKAPEKSSSGKVRAVHLEVADNGGFLARLMRDSGSKEPMLGREETQVFQNLEGLIAFLRQTFGGASAAPPMPPAMPRPQAPPMGAAPTGATAAPPRPMPNMPPR